MQIKGIVFEKIWITQRDNEKETGLTQHKHATAFLSTVSGQAANKL